MREKMQKVDLKRLKSICQPEAITARAVEHWYGPFYRWVDLRVTWLLLHLKWITPNAVTLIVLLLSAFGGLVLLLPGYYGIISFVLIFQLWVILDGVDGEIARYQKRFSLVGQYWDLLGHFLVYISLFLGFGYKMSIVRGDSNYLIWGFIASVMALLCNLPGVARKVIFFKENAEVKERHPQKSTSLILSLYRFFNGPLEISVFMTIFLILRTEFPRLQDYHITLKFMMVYTAVFFISFILNFFKSKEILEQFQSSNQN